MNAARPPGLVLLAAVCCGLTGCQSFYATSGVFAGMNVAALTTIGRGVPDAIYSAISGRDCSSVRLEQGRGYCVPPEPPPAAGPFCTRSIGASDCWAHPELLADQPRELADAPALDREQIAHGAHRWPAF